MPTILTFLLAPICMILAIYRLFTIPWQLMTGRRRFKTAPTHFSAVWAGVAYCALLGYLAWLCVRVYSGISLPETNAGDVLRLVLYFEGFPLVYVLAESRFFYGFDRSDKAVGSG